MESEAQFQKELSEQLSKLFIETAAVFKMPINSLVNQIVVEMNRQGRVEQWGPLPDEYDPANDEFDPNRGWTADRL